MMRMIQQMMRKRTVWEIDHMQEGEFMQEGELVSVRVYLTKEAFEQLFIEYIEHDISKDDFVPFIKRFIEEDEGEWVEVNGERYPEE